MFCCIAAAAAAVAPLLLLLQRPEPFGCALVAVVGSWLVGRLGIRRASSAVGETQPHIHIDIRIRIRIHSASQPVSQSDTHPQVSSS